jgi:pimeloyl-ACP methyl ester carboxylesterase
VSGAGTGVEVGPPPDEHRDGELRVPYRRVGTGEPLLLLAPVGLDSAAVLPLAARLADRYTVLVPDLPALLDRSPEADLDRVAGAVGSLLRGHTPGPAPVVGVSFGGMVAQHLAGRHPALVRALALVSTMAHPPAGAAPALAANGRAALTGGMAAVVEPTLQRWFGPTDPAARADCGRALTRVTPRSWAACWGLIAGLDTRPLLGGITAPTLVLVGDADLSTPPARAGELAGYLPDARAQVIGGAHHMGALADPEGFARPLRDFLDECAREAR